MAQEAGAASARAAHLMDLLGLREEELCAVLESEPLTLLSGELEHRPELPILLDLLAGAAGRAGQATLRLWVRSGRAGARPIDMLLQRDFVAFEQALEELADRGFVVRRRGER